MSKWVAGIIREKTETAWPQSVLRLAGVWPDFPTTEELRGELRTQPREIGIPAMVLYELAAGVERCAQPKRRREAIAELLRLVRILPFDEPAARSAAQIRVRLEAAGQAIGPMDTLIAATATAHSTTLVTHNRREFGRVPGLALADWY